MGWFDSAWDAVSGVGSVVGSFVKGVISHALGAITELPGLLWSNLMIPKKLRLRVIILSARNPDTNDLQLVASREAVEEAVNIAVDIYRKRARVHIRGSNGPIIRMSAEPAPDFVLFPPCSDKSDYVGAQFGDTGAWFRERRAQNPGSWFGIGTPLTIFVVDTVQERGGCAVAGLFGGYGYVGKSWLSPSGPGDGVTMAHEMGHVLDLIQHYNSRKTNLMYPESGEPPRFQLSRWQRYVVRGSPFVSYI